MNTDKTEQEREDRFAFYLLALATGIFAASVIFCELI